MEFFCESRVFLFFYTEHMDKRKLFLITLEIDVLEVGKNYNPLPSHLTLVPRFWANESPEEIAELVIPIFKKSDSMPLTVGKSELIGPKNTEVYLVSKSAELSDLHSDLVNELAAIDAEFSHPEFMYNNWTPHISVRHEKKFEDDTALDCNKGYLIEVNRTKDGDMRHIHSSLGLSD